MKPNCKCPPPQLPVTIRSVGTVRMLQTTLAFI